MSSWPNISRARVIRYNAVFGVTCLALVAIYVALVLAGANGTSPVQWLLVGGFAAMGLLALVGAWLLRREDAKDRRAGA